MRLGIYAVGVHGHDNKHCDSLLDAQMSAPVGAALALVDGDIGAHLFLPESLQRPEVQRLVKLADAYVDEECERAYPGRRSGCVEIKLQDGRRVATRVLDPKGESENPMSDADLERKFSVNCEPVIGTERCRALLEAIWQFDRADGIANLLRWL